MKPPAMMGGITIATGLTLLFLPALYAAWFRVAPGVVAEEPVSA
jgi:Cu/Ag efflux pump CusA